MILAPATVLFAPLCLLSVLVGAVLLALCLRRRVPAPGEAPDAGEAAEALLVLLGQVAFALRIASWPALYGVLAAYVPVIPGAMCLFGVLQSAPRLLTAMELLEAGGLVVAGAAALALGLYRSGRTAVGPGVLRVHLGTLAVISVTLGTLGLTFLLMDKGVKEVSCCQGMSAREAAPVIRDFRLAEVLGHDLRVALTQMLGLASVAMMVWTIFRARALPLVLSPVLALGHLFLALATVQADLAPIYTGKADHHCLYCIPLTGLAPGGILLAMATVPPLLYSWYRFLLRDDEKDSLRPPGFLILSILAVPLFWIVALHGLFDRG